MNKKYYTPEISEFHAGFEYEIFHNNEWKKTMPPKRSIGNDFIFEIKNMGHWNANPKPRVKHLDKEDIESLGFIDKKLMTSDNREISIMGDLQGDFEIYDTDDTGHCICKFNGAIKNKSELKILMKQLKIT